MKVDELFQKMIKKSGVDIPKNKTCDQFIFGDKTAEIKKIATTFMATDEVIEKAIADNVNLIITHEPTWYSSLDKTDWLTDDSNFKRKVDLLSEHHIAIFRWHDHMHMQSVDGIGDGFVKMMGWEGKDIPVKKPSQSIEDKPGLVYAVHYDTLADLVADIKQKLGMSTVRILGNPNITIDRIGLFYGGGSLGLQNELEPMKLTRKYDINVGICGDIKEWTFPAYIRDASYLGQKRSLILLGHERSEEYGMKFLPTWLKPIIGSIPVVFIDTREPFQYL